MSGCLERTRGDDADAYEGKERGGHAKDEGLVTHGLPPVVLSYTPHTHEAMNTIASTTAPTTTEP